MIYNNLLERKHGVIHTKTHKARTWATPYSTLSPPLLRTSQMLSTCIRIKKPTSPREPAGYRGFRFCFLLHLIKINTKTPSARACPCIERAYLTSGKKWKHQKNSKNL